MSEGSVLQDEAIIIPRCQQCGNVEASYSITVFRKRYGLIWVEANANTINVCENCLTIIPSIVDEKTFVKVRYYAFDQYRR